MTPGYETEQERFEVAALLGVLGRELKLTGWRSADQLDGLIDILVARIQELEEPKEITDPADLDRLPLGAVVREVNPGEPREVFCKMFEDGTWVAFGDDERYHWSQIQLPVVLVLPGWDHR